MTNITKPKLLILNGTAQNSLTYFSKAWVSKYPDSRARVSRQELKDMLFADSKDSAIDSKIIQLSNYLINNLLVAGNSVVIEGSDLTEAHSKNLIRLFGNRALVSVRTINMPTCKVPLLKCANKNVDMFSLIDNVGMSTFRDW